MKAAKISAIVVIVYIGVVISFESLLGYFQPAGQSTMVITASDEDGSTNERVVARLEVDGTIYAAANHWPRAWYRQVLNNPNIELLLAENDGSRAYIATSVDGEEHERVDNANSLGLVFRLLTGFPPRYFVRLEPR